VLLFIEKAMTDPILSAAFGNYDRINPLRTGSVQANRIELRIQTLPATEIFRRMCSDLAFDVSEMSMGAHIYLTGTGDNPFVGMPAFVSRAFRHGMVYANADAAIESPEDLNGKRIAIREWGMTAVVWIVGILAEEHGFDLRSVEWVAEHEPRVPIAMPEGMRIRYMRPDEDISELLDAGNVDAALIHKVPACFENGSPRVRRVFPDYAVAERQYYDHTGIHPIMHCVVVRRDVHEKYPSAVGNVYEALCDARRQAMASLRDTGAYSAMIPFLPAVMDETRQRFGDDFWLYGIEDNRTELECLLRYAHQQGLTPRLLSIEELFDSSFHGK
jgi:4,5-dihydroxyphthalate decarboxylase